MMVVEVLKLGGWRCYTTYVWCRLHFIYSCFLEIKWLF